MYYKLQCCYQTFRCFCLSFQVCTLHLTHFVSGKYFLSQQEKKMLNFNIIIIISFSEFHKHKMENVSLFHIFVWQTTHFSRIFFSMSSYKEEGKKILFCSDTTLFSWWFIFQTFLKWNCHFHLPKMVLIPI